MLSKEWRLACLGVGALVVSMSQARADETIRLGAKGSIQDAGANLSRLDLRPQEAEEDDTVPVWNRYRYGYGRGYYGGGFGGGFNRGYYGGYRNFYGGYYGGYRGFYPGYSIGFSYYQPRYYSGYYGGGGYGYGSYYGGYGGYYGGGFCQISGSIQINQAPPATLQLKPVAPMNPIIDEQPVLPAPQPRLQEQQNPNNGFRYDGGPANPVPLPQSTPETKQQPNPQLGIPDRSVSLPVKPSVAPKKFQYAAYGEKPKTETETAPAKIDDTLFVKGIKK